MEGRANHEAGERAAAADGGVAAVRELACAVWRLLRGWPASEGVRRLARAGERVRFGYVAKGALYVVIGALTAAVGLAAYGVLQWLRAAYWHAPHR